MPIIPIILLILSACSHSARAEGFIVTAGGVAGINGWFADANVIDTGSHNLTSLPDLPKAAFGMAMAETGYGLVYAIGGQPTSSQVLIYNTTADYQAWEETTPLPSVEIGDGASAVSINGTIYVVGGYRNPKGLAILNSLTNDNGSRCLSWEAGPASTLDHYFSGAVALNDIVYVCGTSILSPPSQKCEQYDPIANQWSPSTPMLSAREGLRLVALNGSVYAIGGAPGPDERYDPVESVWNYTATMTIDRYDHAVATDGLRIYVMGGATATGSTYYDSVEMYSPETNTWQLLDEVRLTSASAALSAVFVTRIASPSEYNQRTNTTEKYVDNLENSEKIYLANSTKLD